MSGVVVSQIWQRQMKILMADTLPDERDLQSEDAGSEVVFGNESVGDKKIY